MPIPMQCQTYADEIARLTAERTSLQEDVSELTGAAKWERLAAIHNLAEQITQQLRALEQCVLHNAPGYETEVVILPAPGATVSLPAEGQLWELRPPTGQREIESRTMAGNRIKFVHAGSVSGASVGVSIREPASSTSTGPLFRSGLLASLPPGSPADPAGLIEIGAAPGIVVKSTDLAALPMPSVPFSPPNTPLPIIITAVAPPTLSAGEITVGVAGTATVFLGLLNTLGLGNIAGPGPAMTVGFAYALAFRLVPSANMNNVGEVVLAVPARPGTLTAMTTVGPTFDLVLNLVAPMVEPVLRPFATDSVQGLLDAAVGPMAAAALGLPFVPPGVVLSLRRIVITPSGITFFPSFPSMGAYGGLLPKINWLAVTDSAGTVVPEYHPTPQSIASDFTQRCFLLNRSNTTAVTVSSVRVEGDPTNSFTVAGTLPVTVPPSTLASIGLRWRPTVAGPLRARLVIHSDSVALPTLRVPLVTSVTPLGPHGALRVTPPSLVFDSVVGQPNSQPLTLENIGDRDADLTSLRVVSENPPGQFAVPFVLPTPVPPGQSRNVFITHSPTGTGNHTAQAELKMQGDTSYFETHLVPLRASATSPDIRLDPPGLDFGAIAPGATSALAFRIANDGDAPLHVSGVSAVISGRRFFLNPAPAFPLTVPPASATSLQVDYTASPTPGQLDNDEFEVASDDPDQPRVRLTVRGLAGGPRISVLPDFIDFHVVRQVPAQTSVAIRNDGSSDLIVESVRLETGQDFSLQSTPPLPTTVAAGTQHTLQVEFQPTKPGSDQDRLIVRSNDARRAEIHNGITATYVP
jgi:hypothetical protein